MAVASPFYLAYVVDDTVAFDPVAHAVMDEYVFNWRRILVETDKPVLELEIKNPHIGLLNPVRLQWVWLSWLNPSTSIVEPLFFGRIVGNPSNALAEVVTVQFVSWPTDYFKRQQSVAETLKVPPFWDEVFVSVEKSDDPNTILESRGALWCVDPITLEVTAEDILDSSDGNVDITADQHFYDALNMHDGDAPLTAVLMDATVSWTQTGRGFVDMGTQHVTTYGGDGFISEWPKPLTSLGSGWMVQDAFADDANRVEQILVGSISYSWTNPEKEHQDGDTLSASYSVTVPATTVNMLTKILTLVQQTGLLDPFAVDGDGDPSPINKPASLEESLAYVVPWSINTSMVLRYDLSRQRTERVRILLTADLQAVINDPLVTQYSETITMTGRDVGVPIVDLLNWTTIADSNVTLNQVIFPDDPKLPGGRSAQVNVVAGHTGTVEPEFSDIPGTIVVDGTAQWASLGTQNPTEGAQDWTAFTGYNAGAIILPRLPLWTTWFLRVRVGLVKFPPVGGNIGLGEIVQGSNGYYFVCTLDGVTKIKEPTWPSTYGATVVDGGVTWTCIGNVLPDGKTYFITTNGGTSGALYVVPQFGAHTALHDQVNDNGVKWVSIGPGDIPAGGTPGNVWARSYFASTRGRKSLEYLLAIGRAHIRKRARAIELEFVCPFELGVNITCRKTVTLHDSRIPGGLALGKVVRAELSANGDTGEVLCRVTIGCCVGRDNAVTTVPGNPVYAAPGYMQSGYQQELGGVVVLPDLDDVGYTPIVAAPNDDGLVLPLDKRQVVITEGILGSYSAQGNAINSALDSMAKAAQLAYGPITSIQSSIDNQRQQMLLNTNSVPLAIQQNPIYYEVQLKPVANGPFFDAYVVQTQMMTLPKGIDLESTSTTEEGVVHGGVHTSPRIINASSSSIVSVIDSTSSSGSATTIAASSTSSASASDTISATGGSGSSLTSPAISHLRTVSAQNSVFNVPNAGTSKSNNLNVFGTSVYSGATIALYLNGVAHGTTTTDGSGNWSIGVGTQSDNSYSLAATVTTGGGTSSLSSTFTYTVAANITGFTNVPGERFNVNGDVYEVEAAPVSYNITNADSHTLRFEVHTGDHWSVTDSGDSKERSEIGGGDPGHQIQNNNPIYLTFEFYLEPGASNDATGYFIFWQLHSASPISPPFSLQLSGPSGPYVDAQGDCFDVFIGWWNSGRGALDNSTVSWTPNLYTSPSPLARGTWHTVEVEMLPNNAGAGYAKVWLNGTQVVNYSGNLGFGEWAYPEFGIYRGSSAPSVQAIRNRNYLLIATVA